MRIKKIGAKLILGILPVVVIVMLILTLISAQSAESIISKQMQERMVAELNAQEAVINGELELIVSTTLNMATTIENGYKTVTPSALETTISEVVGGNEYIFGSGIWFEPNVYRSSEEYYAPYVRSDSPDLAASYDYSNTEYDYFTKEFYTLSQEIEGAAFTEPYYDTEREAFVMTCAAPMVNTRGNFVGCATVDVDMMQIQKLIASIQIGESGDAMLVSGSSGAYLGHHEEEKLRSGVTIQTEENASLVQAGGEILSGESGISAYRENGESCTLYYDTIPEVNWKLIMRVPQSELNAPIVELVEHLLFVCAAALIVAAAAILLQVRSITKAIRKVHRFAGTLADGDFSIEPMTIERADELGQMGQSLNAMYESNRGVIEDISRYAEEITDSSERVNGAAKELTRQFASIVALMNDVNEAMMSASAATEEVNASTQEVSSSVNILAGEADKSKGMTQEIKERAHKIEKTSKDSYDYAIRLSGEYEENLIRSLKNAEVVESIGQMADVISGIAGQVNLLSLNASIEAARAGDAGRGFAVVATEIGKLAGDTTQVVGEIQKTIADVKRAFHMLTEDSKSLIGFLKDTVTPDYDSFVGVARQYGEDAAALERNSVKISEMAANIEGIMAEVTNAVQNIAESTQNTADNSGEIMHTVDSVSEIAEEVSEKAKAQDAVAGSLNEVVGKFKLN